MNKAFTTGKLLKLDDKYFIKPGSGNNVVLVFSEDRFNDDLEPVPFKQEWHFTRIAQALRQYVDLELVVEEKIEDVTDTAERIYKLIDKIDQTFKQF